MKNNQHLSHTIDTLADLDAWIGTQVKLSPMQRRNMQLAIRRTAELSGQLSERVEASASTISEIFARVDIANCRLRPQTLAGMKSSVMTAVRAAARSNTIGEA